MRNMYQCMGGYTYVECKHRCALHRMCCPDGFCCNDLWQADFIDGTWCSHSSIHLDLFLWKGTGHRVTGRRAHQQVPLGLPRSCFCCATLSLHCPCVAATRAAPFPVHVSLCYESDPCTNPFAFPESHPAPYLMPWRMAQPNEVAG